MVSSNVSFKKLIRTILWFLLFIENITHVINRIFVEISLFFGRRQFFAETGHFRRCWGKFWGQKIIIFEQFWSFLTIFIVIYRWKFRLFSAKFCRFLPFFLKWYFFQFFLWSRRCMFIAFTSFRNRPSRKILKMRHLLWRHSNVTSWNYCYHAKIPKIL